MVLFRYVKTYFILLLLSSCNFIFNDHKILEVQVRKDFKKHLKELPQVPYLDLLGRVPRSEEVELGRQLFNDPVLSRNNDVSCATCHLTNHGFADGNSLSIGPLGLGGPTGDTVGKTFGKGVLSDHRGFGDDSLGHLAQNKMFRNTLSTLNVAYRMRKDNSDGLFHDGRFGSLLFQTLLPIHTPMEVCGENPVPTKDNPFLPGGLWFSSPVHLKHVNTFDDQEGRDLGYFNGVPTDIVGIPTFRPNGTLSIPGRNECLAIAIAKLRSIPSYNKRFIKLYDSEVTDNLVSVALTSFLLTHVSKNTPFDQFVKGEDTLNTQQLKGLISFFTPIGLTYKFGKESVPGGGCFKCHDAPMFGGTGYVGLGVRGDKFSPLSIPTNVTTASGAFFGKIHLQRGIDPGCHVENITVSKDNYAPDIGRANATFKNEDCFKIRVPVLRNIIETYPYFHHGTARAQGTLSDDLRIRSKAALVDVIKYHLRGPIDPSVFGLGKRASVVYFDELQQKDYFIPINRQNFVSLDLSDPQQNDVLTIFPVKNFTEEDITNLVSFIAEALYDKNSMVKGDLGNDVSHPKKVLSGFTPSITRDNGNQMEIPPNSEFPSP